MELTNGEKAAGVGFNPSKDPFVDKVKKMYADIMMMNMQKDFIKNSKKDGRKITKNKS